MAVTLHNLVVLREQLYSQYNIDKIQSEIKNLQSRLQHIVQTDKFEQYINEQIVFYENLANNIQIEYAKVKDIFNTIENDIALKVKELFSGNYELELLRDMNDHDIRLNRNFEINEECKEVLIKRLRGYTDFHFPSLELGCRTGLWTNHLVASDPLYLVDLDQKFISATCKQFNEVYKARLRPYIVDLFVPERKNLNILPQEQFGFIFSWEFFNYLPLSVLEYYLNQFYNLLRPGGVALIRFNNGDTSIGASLAETRWQSYISGGDLEKVCSSIGFEIISIENINFGETSWIEIKRPGTLKTVKASQALGAIKEKIN